METIPQPEPVGMAQTVPVPARHDASDLAATVDRARHLLDEGDVLAAKVLAGKAYDDAKQLGTYAARFKAGDGLLAKARRMQGDALLIEARVQILIANEVDAGQAAGTIATRGKPKAAGKKPPGAGIIRLDEMGITSQRLADARKLRDAERENPGIAEQAIAARLKQGLEPTRANLRAAVGTASASAADRGDNLYETPPEAMHTLLALETFAPTVFEPACGRGAIARPLEAAGHDVILSDINDYGTADRHGECQFVVDFLDGDNRMLEGCASTSPDIISNPPYGAVMNRFIRHALETFRPRKMAMLCQLNVLAGFDDPDRTFYMEDWPPARIYVFKRRLPMMHRDGWDGPKSESRMNTCWLVWERVGDADRPYGTETRIHRVDWQDYAPAEAA